MGVAELTILLPVAAFIALALAVAVVLRRAGRIMARTREVEHFRSAVRDLSSRIDRSLEGAAGRVDAVRRGQLGADAIGQTIEAATDAVTASPFLIDRLGIPSRFTGNPSVRT